MAEEKQSREPWKFPPEFAEIDGVIYLPKTTRELLATIPQLPVKEGDVFVATYPKAGTTWVSEILWQIYNDGKVDTTQMRVRVPFVEEFEILKAKGIGAYKGTLPEFYSKHHPPRIFKTHLQYCHVPKGEGSYPMPKYVYVIRNPKDCAVSFFHHLLRFKFYNFDREWDEYFELLISGKVEAGSWMDHVLSWWAHKDHPNILFLKYEDMKKDLAGTVRKIAQFVGKSASEELVQQITKQTTFDAMKNGEQFYQEKNAPSIKDGATQFIRKGTVGDWQNYFTKEQSERFDDLYNSKMSGSGLEIEF